MSAPLLKKWATKILLVVVSLAPLGVLSCVKEADPGAQAEEVDKTSAALTCQLGQECCPAGFTQVTLTQNSDSFSTSTSNQCIVALGGSDIMSINGVNDIVLAGDGDDNIFAGPTSLVRGGNGNDTINVYGGPATVYGGPGDDTINAQNGDNFVVPGPGRDTVAMGTGNDTVAIYDLCEASGGGKNLDGSSGFNTLIIPVPLDQFIALGNSVSNFQHIVVQNNSCKSECVPQPNCGPNGTCSTGPLPGQMICECRPPFDGPQCQNICTSPVDSDRDGIKDCYDGCPSDPRKTSPGTCGCNVPDIDTDGDRISDCIDECPLDPKNTSVGQCGCIGKPGLKPAGTPCSDPACPLAGGALTTTCDGAGVCGNRNSCIPNPNCKLITWHQTSFWFCGTSFPPTTSPDGGLIDAGADGAVPPGGLTETGAQAACSGKNLTLARIDSAEQNRFFAQLLTAPTWLGGNDLGALNVWRWSIPGNNSGDQFWQGGATGTAVGGRFAYWLSGSPGTQNRCMTMRPGDGRWVDTNCAETHGYICEFQVPIFKIDGSVPPLTPMPAQPPPRPDAACMPIQDSGLPDTLDALAAQIQLVKADVFVGAAANPPPPGSKCPDNVDANAIGVGPPDSGQGCTFTNIDRLHECKTDSQCSGGQACRHIPDDPTCVPFPDAGVPKDGATCLGHARCGTLSCPVDDTNRCGQVELCNQGVTDFDARLDPGSNLDAGAFNPASLFDGPILDARPSDEYFDPPLGAGAAHTWCSMAPQDPNAIKPAQTQPQNYNGRSGQGTTINFEFDPNLIFEADPRPLALGETNLHLRAAAKLKTTVALQNFLGQSFTADIFDASIGIVVDRCSVNDVDETHFTLFDLDIISGKALGIPQINTNDPSVDAQLYSLSQNCNSALGNFQMAADRAKKAFRDAQQLAGAYQTAKQAGKIFSGDLCKQIGVVAADVPWFPGGNACPIDEPVEFTINRFIDFYQGAGFGQVDRLREAQTLINAATGAIRNGGVNKPLFNPTIDIANFSAQESATLVNAPFAIGPVPMVLQIDVFATYGIIGGFDALINAPLNLDMVVGNQPSAPATIAKVGARVVPYASAGLSAFVGAGFDLGAISATIGIEGALTLARISAPIYAGATLNMQVLKDQRPVPPDLLPPVTTLASAFHFGTPKSFKFLIGYNYGVGVDLNDVLSGEINARLRIKFFFFSRTWRSRVVKFNGWNAHFDIIKGGSDPSVTAPNTPLAAPDPKNTAAATTKVAGGDATLGLREAQVPLMQLARLPVPRPGEPPDGSVITFDASGVSRFFYDDLCCSKTSCNALNPFARPRCCPGYTCINPVSDAGLITIPFCQKNCGVTSDPCSQDSECCPGTICRGGAACGQCSQENQDCRDDHDCCGSNSGVPPLSCGPDLKCIPASIVIR